MELNAPRPIDADRLRCVSCHEPRDAVQLDRQLWCSECRTATRRVAARWGRLFGLIGAAALAVWIARDISPAGSTMVVWGAIVLFAYLILGKLGQELVYGAIRARRTVGL